jgi:hypothetical protein
VIPAAVDFRITARSDLELLEVACRLSAEAAARSRER